MKSTPKRKFFASAMDYVAPLALIAVCIATLVANAVDLLPSPTPAFVDHELPSVVYLTPETEDADKPAELVLKMPTEACVGDLILVDASESRGDSFRWEITGVKDGNYRVIDAGTKVLIAADRVGDITVNVATAVAGTVDLETRVVKVVRATVTVVDNAVDVVDTVVDTLKQKVQDAIDKVQVPDREQGAAALANTFETLARLADVGGVEDVEGLVKLTQSMNEKALGKDADQWRPVLAIVEEHITSLAKDGKLKTLPQHARAWEDIAALLRR